MSSAGHKRPLPNSGEPAQREAFPYAQHLQAVVNVNVAELRLTCIMQLMTAAALPGGYRHPCAAARGRLAARCYEWRSLRQQHQMAQLPSQRRSQRARHGSRCSRKTCSGKGLPRRHNPSQ